MNCPFYGRALVLMGSSLGRGSLPFILLDQSGNQCAIAVSGYIPCLMEVEGETPNWTTCPRVAEIRISLPTHGSF